MFDVNREQSDSVAALLGILYRLDFIEVKRRMHDGSVMWWLPKHWTVAKVSDSWGGVTCAYDLAYTRSKNGRHI